MYALNKEKGMKLNMYNKGDLLVYKKEVCEVDEVKTKLNDITNKENETEKEVDVEYKGYKVVGMIKDFSAGNKNMLMDFYHLDFL